MKRKLKYIDLFYVALFLWSFAYTLLIESTLQEEYGNITGRIYTSIWLLVRILLIIKILHDILKNRKILFIVMFIALIGYCSFLGNSTGFILPLFWFGAAGKNSNIKRINLFNLIGLSNYPSNNQDNPKHSIFRNLMLQKEESQ